MSKFAVLIFCGALALLAGCATPPEAPPESWAETNQVLHAQAKVPGTFKPILPAVPTNAMPLLRTNAPMGRTNAAPTMATNAVAVKPRTMPVYTWTSLVRWAAEQKLQPPRLLTKAPLVTYAVSSTRGTMVLAIGIREAAWNGVSLHLGFAPEIIDGEVYVHSLDLQKSLEPFLCAPPLTFSTNRVIVLDPGHGGVESGTVSVTDHRPEKEFTLDWARRLQPLLEQEGWHVFLTRTSDVDVALSNRVAFAESHHADLFMSLHFNSAAPNQKPFGLETYCLTPEGMPSTLTRGYPDVLYSSFPNNNYDAQNLQLAERLQRELVHDAELEDRGIFRARFIGVLRGQHRPSVLIEGGFLSNPHEAKRIESPDFRQKLAEAIAAALK